MESEGTAQSQTSSAKDKQARRLWTHKEEECLLAAMMECISEKYRAHNGFKPGYFNEVEKELKKKLPGTTLKAVPNIESKVKTWKKMYALILDITRISGVGWNYATNSIQVDSEDVWKEYEKSNTKAKGMNGKAFPMYESWQFLFGRDRATGEGAEDAAELDDIPGDPVETINLVDLFNDCYTPSFANGDPAFVDITTSSGTPTSYANPTTPRSNANTPATNVGPEMMPCLLILQCQVKENNTIGWFSLAVVQASILVGRPRDCRLMDTRGTCSKDTPRTTKRKEHCYSSMRKDTGSFKCSQFEANNNQVTMVPHPEMVWKFNIDIV
ncbi:hypothetical protein RHMOL_Rhmol10G0075300 [Rhododendron molle]|uniref:Uncharacterized protein n=1 Tax=Rhododendron molle TaxID=49168 RepID=A0ACC0LZY4_RHOML|nr:hypothetical protein RHMOL_Rhmol10G0075300 [Rhododendron molle]